MLATIATAAAQAPYPNRNITLVLPFAAGSGTDTTTRLIGKELGTALGVSTVIENKAGANGSIAASFVARAPADGYTLFVTTNTTHSANPYLLKTMSYDPIKDFTPIARTGDLPFMLVIHPDIPANSVAELIALAKKEPGKYSYASGSSSAIVSGATFARLAGIDLLHVPYKGSAPAVQDLIGGQVQLLIDAGPVLLPQIKGGRLKALAVTGAARDPNLPDVPTARELGFTGMESTGFQGLVAPPGLPRPVLDRLAADLAKVLAMPDIKAKFAAAGSEVHARGPEAFAAFVKADNEKWSALIKKRGIKLD
jgi:tripartite-type tricarboxylate transporter receptor subunit TctC